MARGYDGERYTARAETAIWPWVGSRWRWWELSWELQPRTHTDLRIERQHRDKGWGMASEHESTRLSCATREPCVWCQVDIIIFALKRSATHTSSCAHFHLEAAATSHGAAVIMECAPGLTNGLATFLTLNFPKSDPQLSLGNLEVPSGFLEAAEMSSNMIVHLWHKIPRRF